MNEWNLRPLKKILGIIIKHILFINDKDGVSIQSISFFVNRKYTSVNQIAILNALNSVRENILFGVFYFSIFSHYIKENLIR